MHSLTHQNLSIPKKTNIFAISYGFQLILSYFNEYSPAFSFPDNHLLDLIR